MAVQRQGNWLGQQRLDVPDLRGLESATSRDFDILAGITMGGKQALVVKGFTITTANKLSATADTLLLNVADGVLFHYNASESGTIYISPTSATTELLAASNSKVMGAFTASATNYIGLDYVRSADDTTADLTKFIDANSNSEISQIVPKAKTLNYRIIITTQPFSSASNILPLAVVVTGASNEVVSIKDTRNMFFRLGSGGDTASASATYSWANRRENSITYAAGNTNDPFYGGDKQITSLKDWMNAVMTSIWETRGGEYWYSPQHRDQVKLIYGGRVQLANGDNFYYDSGTGKLYWSGLRLVYENGNGVYYNDISDNNTGVDFASGQCLYVDIDRTRNIESIDGGGGTFINGLTAYVTNLESLGSSSVPGRRYVLAWISKPGAGEPDVVCTRDRSWPTDRTFSVATNAYHGVVRLNRLPQAPNTEYNFALNPSADNAPVVVAVDENGIAKNTAKANNSPGFHGVGQGTGAGVKGEGASGTTNGPGAEFIGGSGSALSGGAGDTGVQATGGTGGSRITPASAGDNGGAGITATGGANGTGTASNGVPGNGANFNGGTGTGTNVPGGHGVAATGGGATDNAAPGRGGSLTGGAASSGNTVGGSGLVATGGASNRTSGSVTGGAGVIGIGGAPGVGSIIPQYGVGILGLCNSILSAAGLGGYGVVGNVEGANGRAGVYGFSTDAVGIYGYSDNNNGIKGESANEHAIFGVASANGKAGIYGESSHNLGYGVMGVATNDGDAIYADAQGTGAAVRINGGDIKYVTPPTRYIVIGASDFQTISPNSGYYDFFAESTTSYWCHATSHGDQAMQLHAVAHLPIGATITGVRVLCRRTAAGTNSSAVKIYSGITSLVPGAYPGPGFTQTDIFDGTAGHGAFDIDNTDWGWKANTATVNNSVTVGDDNIIRIVVDVGADAANEYAWIAAVRIQYTQAEISRSS